MPFENQYVLFLIRHCTCLPQAPIKPQARPFRNLAGVAAAAATAIQASRSPAPALAESLLEDLIGMRLNSPAPRLSGPGACAVGPTDAARLPRRCPSKIQGS